MNKEFMTIKNGTPVYTKDFFETSMKSCHRNSCLKVLDAEYLPFEKIETSIPGIYSESLDLPMGIRRYKLTYTIDGSTHTTDVVVKTKPELIYLMNIAVDGLISSGVNINKKSLMGMLMSLGYDHTYIRETTIYKMQNTYPQLKEFIPKFYGKYRFKNGATSLILQSFPEAWLKSIGTYTSSVSQSETLAGLSILSKLHRIFYKNTFTLTDHTLFNFCIKRSIIPKLKIYYFKLLKALRYKYRNNDMYILTEKEYTLIHDIIGNMYTWLSTIEEMPKTLIHNDPNIFNFAIADSSRAERIYLFDWELSRLGIHQRDICTFLTNTLPINYTSKELFYYLDIYRNEMLSCSQTEISPNWKTGYLMGAYEHLLQRQLFLLLFTPMCNKRCIEVFKNTLHMIEILSE